MVQVADGAICNIYSASDAFSYVTGHTLVVDCGFAIQQRILNLKREVQ
jgi:enoyl-[acyl-carrier-protein] reductase (NADH)